MEATHYYPFGLTMAGISSKAVKPGSAENDIKFQGQELASKEFNAAIVAAVGAVIILAPQAVIPALGWALRTMFR